MNSKRISIFQWNCRCLNSTQHYLINHLSKFDYQILLLQSLDVRKNEAPKIEGYYYPPIRQTCSEKLYTAIYVKYGLEYTFCKSPIDHDNIKTINATCIRVKFSDKFIVNFMSLYLVNGPDDTNTEWIKHLKLNEFEGNWVIGGDFNAHSPLWEDNCIHTTSKRLVENIVDSPLVLLNDGRPTRVPHVSGHRETSIDLTLVSPNIALDSSWYTIPDTLGSDHIPIVINLKEERQKCINQEDKVPKYQYKKADWDAFKFFLTCSANEYEQNIINSSTVDEMYDYFVKGVLSAAEKSIPKCKPINPNCRNNEWWNAQCEEAVIEKSKAFKTWLGNKNKETERLKNETNTFSNKVCAQAKLAYLFDYCKQNVKDYRDSTKVYRKVNQLKNGYVLPSYPITLNGNAFPNDKEKAEALVNFYAKNSNLDGLSKESQDYRKIEEDKDIYSDPIPDNNHYINSTLTFTELKDAIRFLPNKKTSVGIDAISNEMLRQLPDKWLNLLLLIFRKVWESGDQPQIWKSSIIVPILKQGKPKSEVNSYRPVALTSHTAKLMERIILNRLGFFCAKNHIISKHQAGFRQDRSTIDHIVKLTTHVKKQFAKRKSCLAVFFDITKAYDNVWHKRLLYKLKTIGISGHTYEYLKSYLINRTIQVRVGTSYSTPRNVCMGIPQGSVIAPMLFNLMLFDLPSMVSKGFNIAQYADDLVLWYNCKLRKNTNKRMIKYHHRLFQIEIDKLSKYMDFNGFSFSPEKTNVILFNNGESPFINKFTLNGKCVEYSKSVRFLGVYLTSNLSWKMHLEKVMSGAQKSLNLLKIVNRQRWGQDTQLLLLLAQSLVRSKLMYAQEAFFNAPKSYLDKLQSIDAKAVKLALGVPVHSSTKESYRIAGLLPLNEVRKLSAANYVMRCQSVDNSSIEEVRFRSDLEYPKRSKDIKKFESIASYSRDLFEESNVSQLDVAQRPSHPILPFWEMKRARFDYEYVDIKKGENDILLSTKVKEHIYQNYNMSSKVFTDGSKLENNNSGSGFVIPELKVKKSYHLGKYVSVFTAELVAILMVLYHLLHLPFDKMDVLVCVDNLSAIQSIHNYNLKSSRSDIILEILHLIHCLIVKGFTITFLWVPSHVGIMYNDWADRAAKDGAKNVESEYLHVHLSKSEATNVFKECLKRKFYDNCINSFKKYLLNSDNRNNISLLNRMRVNAWKTKYVKDIKCVCDKELSIEHIFSECNVIKTSLLNSKIIPSIDIDDTHRKTVISKLLNNEFEEYPVKNIINSLNNHPIISLL